MSIPGSSSALFLAAAAAGAGGYQVERSLRFNSSDSAFLSRTPASAGNRKTWTWAAWVKRSAISSGSYMDLFTALTGANDFTEIRYHFNANDDALMLSHVVGGVGYYVYSSNVFRDPSSWYHIVVAVDTTQATSANRVKIYVNGVQVTQNTSGGYPAQNSDTSINATAEHRHGSINTYGRYFSGYLADIHFIDGQALTPSSFTEVSATTGQLIPKAYTGSFGTNGFWLKFSDNSAATATTLGKDYSGNSNNWTPNNLSVTAGAGNDSLVDTPTSYGTDTGAGGEVRGNYCTWNPLDTVSATLTNGNLDISTPSSGFGTTRGTFGVSSGKWYFEHTITSGATAVGVLRTSDSLSNILGGTSGGYSYYSEGPGYTKKINNNVQTDYGASFVAGDVIGVALDLDAGTITFYKNGSSQGQAFSGLSGTFAPAVSDGTNAGSIVGSVNFGQRPFAYTAPSGFKALVDTNLPTPVVAKPNTVMDVKLYTATDGVSGSVSGVNFSPDFVWIKSRAVARSNVLMDTVRGTSSVLWSDLTDAQLSSSQYVSQFNSDGFNYGVAGDVTNGSTVAWMWDAGTSTVTNTQGSITSSVRANASAGFSVVKFNQTSSNQTIGHGLNVEPAFIIGKTIDDVTNWRVYHKSLGTGNNLFLNLTNASSANSDRVTAVSSSTFTCGGIAFGSYGNQIAYCFAPVTGYSSFGSYTGNGSGSPDGPFIYTGFRPRWILFKNASTTNGWRIMDTSINPYNVVSTGLYPYLSNAEDSATNWQVDYLSNGFKVRSNSGQAEINGSGNTIIYAAFAESPFNYSRAR